MKSYTDLKQSKKLAEILPIESADMEYILEQWRDEETHRLKKGYSEYPVVKVDDDDQFQVITLPCWSLNALLEILDPIVVAGKIEFQILMENGELTEYVVKYFHTSHGPVKVTCGNNRVDAVFEMIAYLKENKLI